MRVACSVLRGPRRSNAPGLPGAAEGGYSARSRTGWGVQGGRGSPVKGGPDPRAGGDHSPHGRGGGLARSEATMRRGGVDRLAATLLYADRNSRKSSLRRRSPLTKTARLASTLEACPLGIVRTGIFPAPAVLRRIVDILDSLPADGEVRMVAELYPSSCRHQAVISPQRNPASSRATAAATTLLTFLRVASRRNLPQRRTCAAHARSRVAGEHRSCARRIRSPT